MSDGSADSVIIDIHNKLNGLPSAPSNPSIFRVGCHLRSDAANNVYDPEILAVGPYHHGMPRLQDMEEHKYRYLKLFLKHKNEQRVDKYVTAVAAMEKRARKCYAEPLDLVDKEFVSLLVLDGLFLIELFRNCSSEILRDADDPIFRHERILSQLRHDILLLENQLPFFVLNQLFNMTKNDENPDEDLIALVVHFFDGIFLDSSLSQAAKRLPVKKIDHICGLIHDVCCLPFSQTISYGYITKTNEKGDNWNNINSVSGLLQSGIKFKRANEINNLMNIRFKNGVLSIPQLTIFDETESQLRNLIAYEQYLSDGEHKYFSDYVFVMHCLIKTSNDVDLLHNRGIIDNRLGHHDEVRLMYNRLGRDILISSCFCYSQVFYEVNRHCRRRANRWKEQLRRNYFNNPWVIMSFLAAVALLSLTLTQTTYTILTYYNRRR